MSYFFYDRKRTELKKNSDVRKFCDLVFLFNNLKSCDTVFSRGFKSVLVLGHYKSNFS